MNFFKKEAFFLFRFSFAMEKYERWRCLALMIRRLQLYSSQYSSIYYLGGFSGKLLYMCTMSR
jgi:hypothetical protein